MSGISIKTNPSPTRAASTPAASSGLTPRKWPQAEVSSSRSRSGCASRQLLMKVGGGLPPGRLIGGQSAFKASRAFVTKPRLCAFCVRPCRSLTVHSPFSWRNSRQNFEPVSSLVSPVGGAGCSKGPKNVSTRCHYCRPNLRAERRCGRCRDGRALRGRPQGVDRSGQGRQDPAGTSTLVVGNPLIADVTMFKGGVSMVVTAKGVGQTNLIAIDASGNISTRSNFASNRPDDAGRAARRFEGVLFLQSLVHADGPTRRRPYRVRRRGQSDLSAQRLRDAAIAQCKVSALDGAGGGPADAPADRRGAAFRERPSGAAAPAFRARLRRVSIGDRAIRRRRSERRARRFRRGAGAGLSGGAARAARPRS